MKNFFLSISMLLSSIIFLHGQTATSIANGNWTNPLTWSCTCVPTPGYTVTINHNVVLNTNFGYTTGGITITSGASLLDDVSGRDMWVNGGSFTNNGSVDFHYLLVQAGTFANSGTLTARAFATYVGFTNTGTFLNIDSMLTTGLLINNGNFTNIDSITNTGTFTNNGTCLFNQFTNTGTFTNNIKLTYTDVTNTGNMTNADTMICSHSSWNLGNFTNFGGAYFLLTKSLLNSDIISHDAVFKNDGKVRIMDSWYNFDTIKGTTGSFVVADSSVNSGYMKESFDFCDLTPPSSAPYVDFNLGTVSPAITWCVNTGIVPSEKNNFEIYPNPANEMLHINAGDLKIFFVRIYDCTGNLIGEYSNKSELDLSGFAEGLYYINVSSENFFATRKVQVIR